MNTNLVRGKQGPAYLRHEILARQMPLHRDTSPATCPSPPRTQKPCRQCWESGTAGFYGKQQCKGHARFWGYQGERNRSAIQLSVHH